MQITENNVESLISECWEAVQNKVENGQNLSSEKTLCFLFAMELFLQIGIELKIDFENQCYDELTGKSKYLDLLFYTNDEYKVAIEFKFPKKSNHGNSNQTQTRESVYRDLARLNYLKSSSLSPKACYFLMATNEDSYLNKGNYKKGLDFITANNHIIQNDNCIEAEGLSLSGTQCEFEWLNTQINTRNKCIKNGEYAWLKPIRI